MAGIGIINSKLYEGKIADHCPACKNLAEMDLVVYQRIVLLVLPAFPVGRKAEVTCTSCGTKTDIYKAPHYVSARYNEIAPQLKTPKWAYSFLFLMVIIPVVAIIYMPYVSEKHTGYINSPHIGDVYEIKYEDSKAIFNRERYTLLRVVDTTATSISFNTCVYEATGTKKLGELRAMPDDELWYDDTVTYTKAQLIKDLDIMAERHIWDINRK